MVMQTAVIELLTTCPNDDFGQSVMSPARCQTLVCGREIRGMCTNQKSGNLVDRSCSVADHENQLAAHMPGFAEFMRPRGF